VVLGTKLYVFGFSPCNRVQFVPNLCGRTQKDVEITEPLV
jgi:hypothetical protein